MAPFKYYVRSALLIGSILFATAYAAGVVQKFATDQLQLGAPGAANKEIIFDTGDGGSNAKISVDDASPSFSLNKTLDVTGAFSATTTGQFGGALNVDGNSVTIGDGLSTNKSLIFDIGGSNPLVRWNTAETALEFSNDGTNFKKIGSGSGAGGGINLLAELNFDFEAGSPPSQWTSSGGTFVADIATPIFDKKSGVWDSSASAQTLTSATKVIERGMIGRKCSANLYYRYASGSANDLQFQVRLNASSTVAEIGIPLTTGSNVGNVQVFFDCPTTDTDTLSVRLLSNVANPGAITVDNAFVGSDKNTFQLSQSELYAGVKFKGNDVSTTSGTVADIPTSTSTIHQVVGNATLVTNTYILRVPKLPKGRYYVSASLPLYANGAVGTNCEWYFVGNGVFLDYGQISQSNSTVDGPMFGTHAQGWLDITSDVGSTVDFKYQWRRTAGAGTCNIGFGGSGSSHSISLYKYPTTSAEAINVETTGWFFDGNIGGDNINLGLGAVSAYTIPNDADLDLVIASGSVPGRITCASGIASSGLTCSGQPEEPGVSVDIPQAGLYEACFDFIHSIGISSGSIASIFQVVRTAEINAGIVEEGKQRTGSSSGTANTTNEHPNKVCGTFNIPNAGRHAFRLAYEQAVSGTPASSLMVADRQANNGQRDMHITIRPINQQMPAPVFTELRNKVNSPVDGELVARARINNNGSTCAIVHQSGTWITNTSRSGTGVCVLTLSGFSSAPACIVMTAGGAGDVSNQSAVTPTSTSITVSTFVSSTGAANDKAFDIICMGPK